MQKGLIAGCALGIAMGWTSPVLGAPANAKAPGGAQVSHLKMVGDQLVGLGCSGDFCASFSFNVNTASGVPSAGFFVQLFDASSFFDVFCNGPEYAQSPNVFTVNKDGLATVFLTLDPLAPNCSGNSPSPITVNLSAQPDGTYHALSDGTTKVDDNAGFSTTYSFRTETWNVIINGTVGSISGPFSGSTQLGRAENKNKQK